jgi:arabinogalactan oligomer/maltooligosaccharide transport system substrate-binding protein
MNTEETKTLEAIVKDFETQNPGTKIKVQNVPFSDAQNKYKISAAAGKAPDVLRSEIAWIAEFANLGILEEIPLSEADKADFLKVAQSYAFWNGKNYGIPQVTDCLALLFNKRIFREKNVKVPETMEELAQTGKTLSSLKDKKWALSFNPAGYWAQIFIWSFGGGLIRGDDSSIQISTPESVAGVQFMIDLMQVYGVSPKEMDFVNGYNNMMTGFKQGRYAMIINGPWATSDVLNGEEFKDPENLGVAIIPKGPKGNFSPVGGHSYVVYKGSTVKPEAMKFASFLSETKNQILFAKNHNLLPTRQSAWNSQEVKNLKLISAFKSQLDVATSRPVIPEGGGIYTALDRSVEDALSLNRDAASAMRKVQKQWQKLLKRRKNK